jgi:hypothetical protein
MQPTEPRESNGATRARSWNRRFGDRALSRLLTPPGECQGNKGVSGCSIENGNLAANAGRSLDPSVGRQEHRAERLGERDEGGIVGRASLPFPRGAASRPPQGRSAPAPRAARRAGARGHGRHRCRPRLARPGTCADGPKPAEYRGKSARRPESNRTRARSSSPAACGCRPANDSRRAAELILGGLVADEF